MEIKLFRQEKKLMCRLPKQDKDTPVYELCLGLLFYKSEQIKEIFGAELPVFVAACEVSKQEELDIAKLNASLETIYRK